MAYFWIHTNIIFPIHNYLLFLRAMMRKNKHRLNNSILLLLCQFNLDIFNSFIFSFTPENAKQKIEELKEKIEKGVRTDFDDKHNSDREQKVEKRDGGKKDTIFEEIEKDLNNTTPILQVALDVDNIEEAERISEEAIKAGVDCIELGTYLIQKEGYRNLKSFVKELKEKYPQIKIYACSKIMDAPQVDIREAAKIGADYVVICGATSDSVIEEAIKERERLKEEGYSIKIAIDLVGVTQPLGLAKYKAKHFEEMGVDLILYHISITERERGVEFDFEVVREVASVLKIPLFVAGRLNPQRAKKAIEAGAKGVIVEGYIINSSDYYQATRKIREAIDKAGPVVLRRLSYIEIARQTVDMLTDNLKAIEESLEEEEVIALLNWLVSARELSEERLKERISSSLKERLFKGEVINEIISLYENKPRLVFIGAGISGLVARYVSNWFNKLGIETRVVFQGDENIPQDFGKKKWDIVIAISASATTPSTISYTKSLIDKGAKLIFITTHKAKEKAKENISYFEERGARIIYLRGRTKEDWIEKEEIGKRVPLGTLFEYGCLIFLVSLIQAIIEEKKDLQRVKEILREIIKEVKRLKSTTEAQKEVLKEIIEVIIQSIWENGYIVFLSYGRLFRLSEIEGARLFQMRDVKVMFINSPIAADISLPDVVIISTMSGQHKEVLELAKEILKKREGIKLVCITQENDSSFLRWVEEKTKENIKLFKISGKVKRNKEIISWFDNQFKEEKETSSPLENLSEINLLTFYHIISACLMQELGLEEKDLMHTHYELAPLEFKGTIREPTGKELENFLRYLGNDKISLVEATESNRLAQANITSARIEISKYLAPRAPPKRFLSLKSASFQALINYLIRHEKSHLKGLNEIATQKLERKYFLHHPLEYILFLISLKWFGIDGKDFTHQEEPFTLIDIEIKKRFYSFIGKFLLQNGGDIYDSYNQLKSIIELLKLSSKKHSPRKEFSNISGRELSDGGDSVKQKTVDIEKLPQEIKEGNLYRIKVQGKEVVLEKIEGEKMWWNLPKAVMVSPEYKGQKIFGKEKEHKEFFQARMRKILEFLEENNRKKEEVKNILLVGSGPTSVEIEIILELFPEIEKVSVIEFWQENVVRLIKEITKIDEEEQRKIILYQADVRELPFSDEQFDMVVGFRVLVWEILREKLEKGWKEVERVLKEEGIGAVYVTVFSEELDKKYGIKYMQPKHIALLEIKSYFSKKNKEHIGNLIIWTKGRTYKDKDGGRKLFLQNNLSLYEAINILSFYIKNVILLQLDFEATFRFYRLILETIQEEGLEEKEIRRLDYQCFKT
ncbi:MAG TPA: SIS domain-containing protein, partial [Candidatus Omnitrophica bacterium]|nr:SIS domain-containing protein [Candidatus Omnitrophota bacterium]